MKNKTLLAAALLVLSHQAYSTSVNKCCTYIKDKIGRDSTCSSENKITGIIGRQVRSGSKTPISLTSRPNKLPMFGISKTRTQNGVYTITSQGRSGKAVYLPIMKAMNETETVSCIAYKKSNLQKAIKELAAAERGQTSTRPSTGNGQCSVYIEGLEDLMDRSLRRTFAADAQRIHGIKVLSRSESRSASLVITNIPFMYVNQAREYDVAMSYDRRRGSAYYQFSPVFYYADSSRGQRIDFQIGYDVRNVRNFSTMDYTVLMRLLEEKVSMRRCRAARF